ncbi:MAG: response regulator [Candidatus Thorarchaeota archaeon]
METRVLLVDDDMELLDIARILLQQKNPDLEIVVATSVKEALEKLDDETFDVIVCDFLMPDSTGLDLLEALRAADNNIGFVIWTGHSSEEVAIKALNLGADHYILKSTDYRNQFSTIKDIIHEVLLHKEDKGKVSPKITQEDASKFIHKLSHDVTGIAHNIMGYATLLEEEINPEYIQGISRLVSKLNDRIKRAVTEIDEETLVKRS